MQGKVVKWYASSRPSFTNWSGRDCAHANIIQQKQLSSREFSFDCSVVPRVNLVLVHERKISYWYRKVNFIWVGQNVTKKVVVFSKKDVDVKWLAHQKSVKRRCLKFLCNWISLSCFVMFQGKERIIWIRHTLLQW